jgi:hypothetical protein
MGKLTGFMAGAVLMFGVGAANAGEAPEILGAADYQAIGKVEMSSVTGESNTNINVNVVECVPTPDCQVFVSSTTTTTGESNTNTNVVSVVSTPE